MEQSKQAKYCFNFTNNVQILCIKKLTGEHNTVSGKKRTPHGPADPDGSQKMFHIFNYNNNKMCYYLRLFR